MPLSTTELNRIADNIVASNLTVYPHSGDPGSNGTSNRIGSASATLASGSWSSASNGDVTYNAVATLGVLNSGSAETVRWYSLFRGNAYVGREQLDSAVSVAQGSSFSFNSGTIVINGASS